MRYCILALLFGGLLVVRVAVDIPPPQLQHDEDTTTHRDVPRTAQCTNVASESHIDPLISPILVAEPSYEFTHGTRALFHPHGDQVCASGCAASRHPTEKLSDERFEQLLLEYATEPLVEAGSAQDTLLYYGRQTTALLKNARRDSLDPARAAILKHELTRSHAEIAIRVVDAEEHLRASLPPTKVPLDRRHEFELDTYDMPPILASGTVKRVGRDFVWTRL
jgi:hypothetical protein